MYKKTLIILGGIVIFCALITVLVVTKDKPVQKDVGTVVPTAPVITYVSTETNETISVSYSDTKAVMQGVGYKEVIFIPVEAASGAKYESKDTNLTLWSKGNEVTVWRGRQIIFVGTDANLESFQESGWEDSVLPISPEPTLSTTTPKEAESEESTASSSETAN